MENTGNDAEKSVNTDFSANAQVAENAQVAANDIENMTLAQIKALKKRYKDEFEELIRKFFEERPLLNIIELKERVFDIGSIMPAFNTLSVHKEKFDGVDSFVNVTLRGDSTEI